MKAQFDKLTKKVHDNNYILTIDNAISEVNNLDTNNSRLELLVESLNIIILKLLDNFFNKTGNFMTNFKPLNIETIRTENFIDYHKNIPNIKQKKLAEKLNEFWRAIEVKYNDIKTKLGQSPQPGLGGPGVPGGPAPQPQPQPGVPAPQPQPQPQPPPGLGVPPPGPGMQPPPGPGPEEQLLTEIGNFYLKIQQTTKDIKEMNHLDFNTAFKQAYKVKHDAETINNIAIEQNKLGNARYLVAAANAKLLAVEAMEHAVFLATQNKFFPASGGSRRKMKGGAVGNATPTIMTLPKAQPGQVKLYGGSVNNPDPSTIAAAAAAPSSNAAPAAAIPVPAPSTAPSSTAAITPAAITPAAAPSSTAAAAPADAAIPVPAAAAAAAAAATTADPAAAPAPSSATDLIIKKSFDIFNQLISKYPLEIATAASAAVEHVDPKFTAKVINSLKKCEQYYNDAIRSKDSQTYNTNFNIAINNSYNTLLNVIQIYLQLDIKDDKYIIKSIDTARLLVSQADQRAKQAELINEQAITNRHTNIKHITDHTSSAKKFAEATMEALTIAIQTLDKLNENNTQDGLKIATAIAIIARQSAIKFNELVEFSLNNVVNYAAAAAAPAAAPSSTAAPAPVPSAAAAAAAADPNSTKILDYIKYIINYLKTPTYQNESLQGKLIMHINIHNELINFFNVSSIKNIDTSHINFDSPFPIANELIKRFIEIYTAIKQPSTSGGGRKRSTKLSRKRSQNISKKQHRHRKTNRNTNRKHKKQTRNRKH